MAQECRIAVHLNFPDYVIHSDGRVFRAVSHDGRAPIGELYGRVLKRSGYRQFKLVNSGKVQVHVRANRLIAETFLGAAPSPEFHAAHWDNDRLNNNVDNIRWATPEENEKDKLRHGTILRGSEMPMAKLTEIEVLKILMEPKTTYEYIAKKYNVGKSSIGKIIRGETWKHVTVGPN